MVTGYYADDRWAFIEKIQDWYQQKSQFWLVLSILAFSSIFVFDILLNFASQANPIAWQKGEFLVIPILAVFVFSIFWRNVFCTFLSCVGAMVTYGGVFFFHSTYVATIGTTFVANRLGYGIKHLTMIPVNSIADRYAIVGIFALAFCLAIAIKPNFFKPKDSEDLPYPVWKNNRDMKLAEGSNAIRLVPLAALLTFAEQNLIARYKYVTVIIGGRKFFVPPYEWVPENSVVAKDDKSGSIFGIL